MIDHFSGSGLYDGIRSGARWIGFRPPKLVNSGVTSRHKFSLEEVGTCREVLPFWFCSVPNLFPGLETRKLSKTKTLEFITLKIRNSRNNLNFVRRLRRFVGLGCNSNRAQRVFQVPKRSCTYFHLESRKILDEDPPSKKNVTGTDLESSRFEKMDL